MIKSWEIKIEDLRDDLFAPYGRILEPLSNESPEVAEPDNFDFYVTFKELSQGWQIGYLITVSKKLEQLERHPNTPEVFSPVTGDTLLVVTDNPEDLQTLKGFKLAKPIVFYRGVWHGVISPREKSEVLIVESPDVIDEFVKLKQTVVAPEL